MSFLYAKYLTISMQIRNIINVCRQDKQDIFVIIMQDIIDKQVIIVFLIFLLV